MLCRSKNQEQAINSAMLALKLSNVVGLSPRRLLAPKLSVAAVLNHPKCDQVISSKYLLGDKTLPVHASVLGPVQSQLLQSRLGAP